jgi:pimeloyl-ACP methyl ester carboxylesterase
VKIVHGILLVLAALFVLAVVAAFSYRAMWQHRIANAVKITSPNGVNEAKFININGAEEWITIRGDDKDNPVILFLHGGPSEANSPFVEFYTPFEKDFVFVQWDQPGAGKTYIRGGSHQPRLTIDSMAAAGIAVAEYVENELRKPKIILIGQDWGGLLGVRMIEQRPDLFAAFAGTGQIVGMLSTQDVQYEYALSHATASHDQKLLDALRQMGPPPYRTLDSNSRFQTCCRNQFWPPDDIAAINRMKAVLVVSPSLSIAEVYGWTKGLRTGERELDTMLMTMEDLRKTDTAFSVPVFFIQGKDDNVTPTSLVADYISKIQAPAKKLDIVPGARLFCDVDTPQRVPQFLERRRTICLDKAWRCELTNEPNNAVRSTHG